MRGNGSADVFDGIRSVPDYLRIRLKPGPLPFGIPAGVALHGGNGLVPWPLLLNESHYMTVPDGLHRFQRGIVSLFQEELHLFQETGGEHLIHSSVDTIVEHIPFQGEPDFQDIEGFLGKSMGGVVFGEGSMRGLADFQGTDDANGIVGMDPAGSFGIQALEPGMQSLNSGYGRFRLEPGTDTWVLRIFLKQPVKQGFDVKAGSAYDERENAVLMECGDDLSGLLRIGGGAEWRVRIDDVDEVMGHGPALLEAGFGRPDVHQPVHLHGIGVDDLGGKVLCNGDAGGGLSHPGRPTKNHYFLLRR